MPRPLPLPWSLLLAAVLCGAAPAGGAEPCPDYDAGTRLGTVQDHTITEISGVVASRRQDGVLWVHNDSGDDPRLYALARDGRLLATVTLTAATHRDWEDLALGPGPDAARDYLYVGDIGDNKEKRTSIRVYRLPEPAVDAGAGAPAEIAVDDVEELRITYPDGAHDAETLLVDPADGGLYVVTKDDSGPSALYRYPAPIRARAVVTLERLVAIPGTDRNEMWQRTPTGGDIAADGGRVALRLYHQVWLWPRAPGQALSEAIAAEPCVASQQEEHQGEAIAFDPDGRGYLTISEGLRPPIWSFRPRDAASAAGTDPG